MLDCVEPEEAPQPNGKPPRPNIVTERCKTAWENFKGFNRDAIVTAITHALVVVRSHYPATDLQEIGEGFTEGLGEAETEQLEDEVENAVKKLAGDIDPFGDTDGDGETR